MKLGIVLNLGIICSFSFFACQNANIPQSSHSSDSNTLDGKPVHWDTLGKTLCQDSGDEDTDNDGICNSLEEAGCEAKSDCDGNGFSDGDEHPENNPIYVATSYIGSLALSQALEDPSGATLKDALATAQDLPVGSPSQASNQRSLSVDSSRAQASSRVSVKVVGGPVSAGSQAQLSIGKNYFALYSETYYDGNIIVNGTVMGNSVKVLQCLKANLQGSSNQVSYLRTPKPPIALEKDVLVSSDYCETIKEGLFVGFEGQGGQPGRLFTQLPRVSGFLETTTPQVYAANVELQLDPLESMLKPTFQFASNGSGTYSPRLSRTLLMEKDTFTKLTTMTASPLRTFIKQVCKNNIGKTVIDQALNLYFAPISFTNPPNDKFYYSTTSGLQAPRAPVIPQQICGECYNNSSCP